MAVIPAVWDANETGSPSRRVIRGGRGQVSVGLDLDSSQKTLAFSSRRDIEQKIAVSSAIGYGCYIKQFQLTNLDSWEKARGNIEGKDPVKKGW
jgi:hypothetical protein